MISAKSSRKVPVGNGIQASTLYVCLSFRKIHLLFIRLMFHDLAICVLFLAASGGSPVTNTLGICFVLGDRAA